MWWKIVGVVGLLLVTLGAAGWFFLPSAASPAFSPWERISGETPRAKVMGYVRAVASGDEAAALSQWELPTTELPNGRTTALRQRRSAVTRELIAAGVRPEVTIQSVEWWRTCCEPGVIDGPDNAGGARMRIQFVDRRGGVLDYVVDAFNRHGAYPASASILPSRHWVVRDVYPADQSPLFWPFSRR